MPRHSRLAAFARGLAAIVLAVAIAVPAMAANPIKIGFAMSLTGGLAVNGKAALVAMQIWRDDQNAKGGLLGRQVEFVYYDDQSNPSNVPGIYTKLLDVDKVDLVVGPYATAEIAPAMPVIMQHNMAFLGLMGLAVNSEFHYPRYFAMIPSGPNPKSSFTKGLFDIAMKQTPKPKTIAIVAADQEFAIHASDGARQNAKTAGLKIVYDKTYPPSTTDYTPIVRAINATNPDILIICSYPPDSVGMTRALNEVGTKAKIIGGAMVGLQATAIKMQLGPLLNGFINFDYWLPIQKMNFPGVTDFLTKYQSRAQLEGVDALGYHIAPWGYAQLQVLQQAVETTKSLDDDKLADHIRKSTFKTLVGEVKFGPLGEWAEPRVLELQFQHIRGNDLGQFKDISTQVVLVPAKYKSGDVIYPYEMAK